MVCHICKKDFVRLSEDVEYAKKFGVELESLCFECDQKQRLCFRNERALYTRKCDGTGETIISIYSPDKPFKVYKSEYWYGDNWNALDYGLEVDFNQPFFEQLKTLQLKVPRLALTNINAVNSDYCNSCYGNKNCYLIFGGDNNEESMFGTLCMKNKNCLDLDYNNQNELCYMLGDSMNCYGCRFVFDSKNCTNCAFVSDCISCQECLLCTNLVNQQYCILNKPYPKEIYEQKKKEFLNGSFAQQQKMYNQFFELISKRTVKYAHTVSSENCTGDYLKNSRNCRNCFDVTDSQDLSQVIFASKSKDCFYSSMLGDNSELCYQAVSTAHCYNVRCSFLIFNSTDVTYSDFILNSHNIFGCVGLKNKQYCILNKQYSKEEYEKLVPKIIEHMKKIDAHSESEWGKFLPKNLSCFGYNETTAYDYYPLNREETLAEGFQWKEEGGKSVQSLMPQIPDNIEDVPDAFVNEILACEQCGNHYKIINQELKFYRNLNIPIPHFCSNCRHKLRMTIRNPRQLWLQNCAKCGIEFQTTYASERPETVFCENCYLKEVY